MVMHRTDPRLGALPPPPDVVDRDRRYRLARTLPPRAVDLGQPRLLSRSARGDVRGAIEDQGGIGACVGFAVTSGAEMCAALAGRSLAQLHPGWVYEQGRRRRGWFPQDSGMYIADGCDLAMSGIPRSDLHPYVVDAAYDYPAEMDAQASEDYVLSHRPFYPSEGGFLENVWAALDAGMPVVFGSYWPQEWYNATGGRIPTGVGRQNLAGAHAYVVWGCIPGYVLCANSWGPGWTPQAPGFGWDMRPGDFALPWEYLQGAEPMVFEGRALSLEPVPPEPEPQPSDCRTRAVVAAETVVHAYWYEIEESRGQAKYAARLRREGAVRVLHELEARL